ncbi:MAG: class I SAM-dependent methyltransferase [Saprospiraceae bacterium]|nr:class I SAM-dependent methyltransferase [Saprospiraceae bacterium]
MNKGIISTALRKLRLLYFADRMRYHFLRVKNFRKNRQFKMQHPDVALPPDDLMYESFQIDYHKYYKEGREVARWLIDLLRRHKDLHRLRILDWGCGPGRVIRHLPELAGSDNTYYATDYNPRSIVWCSKHLKGIAFNLNGIEASLPYPDDHMDVIYGISVFTHLSESGHHDWYEELLRILRPGGIMLLTTQGDNFISKLTASELSEYHSGRLIVRGNVKEGHRIWSAFHPEAFMRALFSGVEILEHISPAPTPGRWLPQDVWIIRKKA